MAIVRTTYGTFGKTTYGTFGKTTYGGGAKHKEHMMNKLIILGVNGDHTSDHNGKPRL